MVCEICKEFSENLRESRRGPWKWNMGSVADIQQRAATCQNCQTISEFIRPEWEVVDTISLESSAPSPDHFHLWHNRPMASGSIDSFIIHDEDVSVGQSTPPKSYYYKLYTLKNRVSNVFHILYYI